MTRSAGPCGRNCTVISLFPMGMGHVWRFLPNVHAMPTLCPRTATIFPKTALLPPIFAIVCQSELDEGSCIPRPRPSLRPAVGGACIRGTLVTSMHTHMTSFEDDFEGDKNFWQNHRTQSPHLSFCWTPQEYMPRWTGRRCGDEQGLGAQKAYKSVHTEVPTGILHAAFMAAPPPTTTHAVYSPVVRPICSVVWRSPRDRQNTAHQGRQSPQA